MLENIGNDDDIEFGRVPCQTLGRTQLETNAVSLEMASCVRNVRLVHVDSQHIIARVAEKARYCVTTAAADVQDM